MLFGGNNLKFRQEWVRKTLKEVPSNKKLIDVGAGECQYKKFCDHLDYTSQDFNQYNGEGDGVGLQTGIWDVSQIDIVSDILNIPVEDYSFDAVLCTEVLEHVPNPVGAIEEMTRLLKKNGILIITAPFCSLTHFAPYHYCDGFSKYFFIFHLERLGFEIVEITPNGNYFEYLAQEMQRLPFIVEKFSKRRSFFMKIVSRIMVYLFKFYNNKSINTESLLCFGFHVKAVKK
jgi:ubiquinone/menaquinone biosynthesis C-methylase UbiE